MWTDDIRRIILSEGDWQGRLIGSLSHRDVEMIQNFSNVDKVLLHGDAEGTTASVYFKDAGRIYEDLPKIAAQLEKNAGLLHTAGWEALDIQYHNALLTRYFIYSPEERREPPKLLFLYACILTAACASLVLIIHNAFAITMNARVHQLGILQSIGATPRQIRTFLTQEALALCLLPVLLGIVTGSVLCRGTIRLANRLVQSLELEQTVSAVYTYPPLLFLAALAACLLTIWLSARIPAEKLSRMTPLEAIKSGSEQTVSKEKKFRIFNRLFGIEGELARKSIYARRRALRTTSLSLTLAFLVFSSFLNFEIISYISTYHTFFERYRNTWDLMVSIENSDISRERLLSDIRDIPGVSSCVSYRKSSACTILDEDRMSGGLTALGGLKNLDGARADGPGGSLIQAPLIILDDHSFQQYTDEAGIDISHFAGPSVIAVNRIWDKRNSNFKNRRYVPYLKETAGQELQLFPDSQHRDPQDSAAVRIWAYTEQPPDLREEYADFSLVQIMPESAYREIENRIPSGETYFKILTASDEAIARVRQRLTVLLDESGGYTLENRLDLETFNEITRSGYKIMAGFLCCIMALIGLANVFSNTLGSVSQRRREFARYLSVGLTPGGMKKILFLEALFVAGKPLLVSLMLCVPFVLYCLHAGSISPIEYISRMPVLPLAAFAALIFLSVGFAYYIGGRSISRSSISDNLKDDSFH